MRLWEIVFLILTFLWIGEFVFKRGKKHTERSSIEKRSFRLILLMISIIIFSTVVFRILNVFSIEETVLLKSVGILIYGGGILVRYWGIRELGHFFSRNVIVEEEVELVSSGPYRILRHPLYTGLLLIVIGFPIYMGVWGGVVLAILLMIPALLYRIRIEEEMLTVMIGSGYQEWGKTRNRLFPFIY